MNNSIMVILVVSWYAMAILVLRILVEKANWCRVKKEYEGENQKVGDVEEGWLFLTWLFSPIVAVLNIAFYIVWLISNTIDVSKNIVVRLIVGKKND